MRGLLGWRMTDPLGGGEGRKIVRVSWSNAEKRAGVRVCVCVEDIAKSAATGTTGWMRWMRSSEKVDGQCEMEERAGEMEKRRSQGQDEHSTAQWCTNWVGCPAEKSNDNWVVRSF